MLYSHQTKGFYHPEIHGDNIPADAVEISDTLYRSLVLGQENGQVIGQGADGLPTLIDPATLPPQVPEVVSRFQAKAALDGWQMLDEVEALMAAPETPMIAKLAWKEAQEFYRDSPTILAMSAALGLTSEQLDQLFIIAAGITA